MAFDLGPVTKYSAEPGLASATFAVVISEEAYNRLSPELQALIDETTGPDRAEWFGAMWDASEARGREYMEKAGVNIVQLSDEQIVDLQETFKGIVDEATAAAGDKAPAFVEAYVK